SPLPAVATKAARRVCLAGLLDDSAYPLATSCISGTEAQRRGAADIFAANLHFDNSRLLCSQALKAFFNDKDEDVRKRAAGCFQLLEDDQLLEHIDVVEAFLESAAFASHHAYLTEPLSKIVSKLPDVTLTTCERIIKIIDVDSADFRTRGPLDSEHVSRLL